ncbi:MAG: class I SAM-dependent methyltransferase, partial [Gammaproteobacteria bacterium]|nr:class I SAM-dependent methyltransferase [Gammaproteobacteria bacterium]
MKQSTSSTETLSTLLSKYSKHSDYQLLHPSICDVVCHNYQPTGKKEAERQSYMESNLGFSKKTVLDIGANTGYFSFGALQAGASVVTAVEGNSEHARFIDEAVRLLNIEKQLTVKNDYYDFASTDTNRFDIILCLNVLHHLGDDFGDARIDLEGAKAEITKSFRNMASNTNWMWF